MDARDDETKARIADPLAQQVFDNRTSPKQSVHVQHEQYTHADDGTLRLVLLQYVYQQDRDVQGWTGARLGPGRRTVMEN